jgi:hypothetical protein
LNTQQTEFVIPIPVDALIKFFGHLCSIAHQRSALREGEELGDDDVESPPYSSVSLYRSAIFDLWKQLKIPVPADTTLQQKRILDGYEKVLNNLRRRGLAKITEGKKDLGFDGYRMLSEKFMEKNPGDKHVGGSWGTKTFAWSFYILCWNLMSRSDSVQALMLGHIERREDCIVMQEQGHKGDQTGRKKYWKHVYANPLQSEICPFLALAVLLFSSGVRATGERHQLFVGSFRLLQISDRSIIDAIVIYMNTFCVSFTDT